MTRSRFAILLLPACRSMSAVRRISILAVGCLLKIASQRYRRATKGLKRLHRSPGQPHRDQHKPVRILIPADTKRYRIDNGVKQAPATMKSTQQAELTKRIQTIHEQAHHVLDSSSAAADGRNTRCAE
jgi:hypothetical protein